MKTRENETRLRLRNGRRWLVLAVSMVWLGPCVGVAQAPNIAGYLPVKTVYATGETIRFYGADIYDDPGAMHPNTTCDSMVLQNTTTLITYPFSPYNSVTLVGDPNYTGISAASDTVYWVISPVLPCGDYLVRFNDDEDCDDPVNYGTGVTISIKDSAIVSYSSATYCMNGSNPPAPTITGDAGTFTDLTGNFIVQNASTGQLMLHSGTAGLNTIRFVTDGMPTTCRDSVDINIQVDTLRVQNLSYGGTQFCQGSPTIFVQAPFDALGGSFSCFPSTPALNTTTGDFNPATLAGSYAITYTPAPGSCENAYTVTIQVDSLIAASFDYDSVYCVGGNYNQPDTIIYLPPGGYFQESGGSGNLVFADSLTGELDLDLTPAGNYHVEYVVSGGCIAITQDSFEVRTAANANFNIQTSFCSNQDSITATGFIPGGTFICSGGQIQFHDPLQGIINVPGSLLGGPYTIFYYVNDPICPDTVQRHVTISTAPTATIAYPGTPYCQKEVDPVPQFMGGTSGGTFTLSPPGTIGASTGVIDLSATNPGTYTVNYSVSNGGCTNAFPVDTVEVLAMPPTHFNLVATHLCQNSGNYLIDTIAPAGASFSNFTMTNAQYVPFPGAISGNNSVNTNALPPGGPFRIHRFVDDGICKDSFVDYVSIWRSENPNFIYAPAEYCQTDRDPVPLILGDGGGLFTVVGATNLSLNDTTGLIDLSTSGSGLHTVQYTTGGPCPQQATFSVLITSATSPDFGYPLNSYCENYADTIFANLLPPQPAVYHIFVLDTGLKLLDSITGAIDILASDTGTYNVYIHLDSTAGNCVTDNQVLIEILAYDSSSINFTDPVCQTDSFLEIYYDSTKAGTFFAASGLVWEDRDSGIVAVYATPPGTYQIRFVVQGVCQEEFAKTLTVETPTYPDFHFQDYRKEFCKSDGSTQAFADNPGGTYSWVPVPQSTNVLVMDPLTGVVNLSASTSGNYDVTYQTSSACPGDTTKRIIIYPNPANALITLEPADSVCVGDPITITGSGSAFFNIRINGVDTSSSNTVTLTTATTGRDTVEILFITQQLCRDSLDTVITVLPRPVVIPDVPDPTISSGTDIEFYVGTNVDQTSFTWVVQGVGQVSFSQDQDSIPPIAGNAQGNITVTPSLNQNGFEGYDPAQAIFSIVPLAYGCYGDTEYVTIRINPEDKPIFIPEVFTPNGDDQNDRWLIQWNDRIRPQDFTIIVYNRSGGQVHSMNPIDDRWDGGSLPDGVYWWNLMHASDPSQNRKGAVTIRRR